jgi:hypothetical protein
MLARGEKPMLIFREGCQPAVINDKTVKWAGFSHVSKVVRSRRLNFPFRNNCGALAQTLLFRLEVVRQQRLQR